MNNVYIRFSTNKQEATQQVNAIESALKSKNLTVDRVEMDEGVSGSIPYKERKLYKYVCSMQRGDCLIVSEVSRLGRSMSDLNKLVNDELKPRGIRLIIVGMGLDLDCSNLKAIDEMIIFAFSFAGQLERDLNKERTRNALEARKKKNIPIGGTNELWGKVTGTDRTEALKLANKAACEARKAKAQANPENKAFRDFMEDYEAAHGKISWQADWKAIAGKLNSRGRTTATGLPYTPVRAKAMYEKMLKLYYGKERQY